MRRFLPLLLLLPVMLAARPHKEPWKLSLGTDIGYDTNVFSLSDSDLDKFDAGSAKFDFMESSDDLILSPWAELSHTWKLGRVKFTPSAKGDYALYMNNGDKSRFSGLFALSASWRKLNVKAAYGWYPDNYVRNYTDQDGTGESEKYQYDKDLLKVRADYRLLKHDTVALQAKYEVYRYNEFFTEYDGDAVTAGIEWEHAFPSFYLTAGYDYRTYDCDPLTEAQIESGTGDGSYDSNLYSVGVRNKKIKIARGKFIRPGLSFDFEDRYYQTENQDLTHANRNDRKYTLTAECSFHIVRHAVWTIAYAKIHRNADSDYNPNLGDTKDYYADQVWLKLRYDLSL